MKPAFDRRDLLIGGASALSGIALSACAARARPLVSRPAVTAADANERALVLIELYGGNDGLSVLVPHEDDAYQRARPTLAMKRRETLALTRERGFHPALAKLHGRFHRGEVAAIEGVGFPNPIFSHFRSQEVWHTARREGRASGPGWIARLRESVWRDDQSRELVVHIGGDMPYSLWSPARPAVSFRIASELDWLGGEREKAIYARAAANEEPAHEACVEGSALALAPLSPRDRVLAELRKTLATSQASTERIQRITEPYRSRIEYPMEPFAQSLRVVAALLQSDLRTRVYSLVLGNFDTHGSMQKRNHEKLLRRLDDGLDAFLADIAGTSAESRALVMAFSEFGRRVHENESGGTDHGAAGPLFFFGSNVRGGLHGQHPSVSDLDEDGNLVHAVDFRRAYATVLERWFEVPSRDVLGAHYEPLDVLA